MSEPSKTMLKESIPFKGYAENRVRSKFVDALSDNDLQELNELLKWNCFTVDSHGRRFGQAAWGGKRDQPQPIPDKRIVMMNEWFQLSDKHVLEIGCFEGVHTIGLSMFARRVTAVDARMENIVKTIVRCAFFGYSPTVFKCDIEEEKLDYELLRADVVHHVGVLYHLKDPVRHLLDLSKFVRVGMMLDTHYALNEDANETYETCGRKFTYKRHQESGYKDVFSGMSDHSKWLRLDDLTALLREAGFSRVDIVHDYKSRNGPRVRLMARRES